VSGGASTKGDPFSAELEEVGEALDRGMTVTHWGGVSGHKFGKQWKEAGVEEGR